MIRRPLSAVAAVLALALAGTATSCSSHKPADAPLTIIAYHSADWITDSAVKPPNSFAHTDRIRYPHTMDGAVMAAVDSQTMLDTAGDNQYGDIARDYFAVGDGLTAYLAARAQLHLTGDP